MSKLNFDPIIVNFHAVQFTPLIEFNFEGTGLNSLVTCGGIQRIQTSADAWKHSIRSFYLKEGGEKMAAIALFGTEHDFSGGNQGPSPSSQITPAISIHEAEFVHDTEEFDDFGDYLPEPRAVANTSYTSYRHASVDVSELTIQLGSMDAALQALRNFGRAFSLSSPPVGEACNTTPSIVVAEICGRPLDLTPQFEERYDMSSHDAAMLLLQRPGSFAMTVNPHFANEPTAEVTTSRVPNLLSLFDAIDDAVLLLATQSQEA